MPKDPIPDSPRKIVNEARTTVNIAGPKGEIQIADGSIMWHNPLCGDKECFVYNDASNGASYYGEIYNFVHALGIEILYFRFVAVKECDIESDSVNSGEGTTFTKTLRDANLRSYVWHQPEKTSSKGFFVYFDQTHEPAKCLKLAKEDHLDMKDKGIYAFKFAFSRCKEDQENQEECGAFNFDHRSINGNSERSGARTWKAFPSILSPKRKSAFIKEKTCMWYNPLCGLRGCFIFGKVGGNCAEQAGEYKAVLVDVSEVVN